MKNDTNTSTLHNDIQNFLLSLDTATQNHEHTSKLLLLRKRIRENPEPIKTIAALKKSYLSSLVKNKLTKENLLPLKYLLKLLHYKRPDKALLCFIIDFKADFSQAFFNTQNFNTYLNLFKKNEQIITLYHLINQYDNNNNLSTIITLFKGSEDLAHKTNHLNKNILEICCSPKKTGLLQWIIINIDIRRFEMNTFIQTLFKQYREQAILSILGGNQQHTNDPSVLIENKKHLVKHLIKFILGLKTNKNILSPTIKKTSNPTQKSLFICTMFVKKSDYIQIEYKLQQPVAKLLKQDSIYKEHLFFQFLCHIQSQDIEPLKELLLHEGKCLFTYKNEDHDILHYLFQEESGIFEEAVLFVFNSEHVYLVDYTSFFNRLVAWGPEKALAFHQRALKKLKPYFLSFEMILHQHLQKTKNNIRLNQASVQPLTKEYKQGATLFFSLSNEEGGRQEDPLIQSLE